MQKNLLRLDKFWEPERPQRAAAPFEGTRLSRPAARRRRQTASHCSQAFSPFTGATRCGISPALFPGEGASGRETSAPIRLRPGRAGGCRATFIALIAFALAPCADAGDRVVYEGKQGPGKGKHIVFLAGDEEYRSEEGMPMLAKILAVRQGFKCTVLFPINPADGTIDPNNQTNIVGLEALKNADMLVMLLRFRELPDAQMKYFVDYLNAGKPILAIRTSTHAFAYTRNKQSPYAKFDWQSKEWPGGFGQQVLGDTWVNHHGDHGKESTRGVINPQFKNHPILKGVTDIWGPTDVYGIIHLPADAQVLLYGQVLEGMKPGDKPVEGPKNNPMMPLVWVRHRAGGGGKTPRIICSTIGAAVDLESEGLRRLFINAIYWGLGLEEKILAASDVACVGEYHPSFFGFGKFKRGLKPSDFELSPATTP